jgi:hypothetical protein
MSGTPADGAAEPRELSSEEMFRVLVTATQQLQTQGRTVMELVQASTAKSDSALQTATALNTQFASYAQMLERCNAELETKLEQLTNSLNQLAMR